MGKVYLVGAGPGNIEYLTLRAHQLLTQAEVLIYDALVDERLLTLVPAKCQKLDMGKRGGRPSPSQAEINQLMVKYCLQGKLVVRLKSGDPFIFGRATSEILALLEANCQFEVVPGVSSALAAPLLAGIPLTDTVLSRCFAVVSAHEPSELDWKAIARLDTVVILMGGRYLHEIVQHLQRHGRSSSTPIAVIRDGGRPEQQVWVGTLKDIVSKTTGVSLSPTVFVIGEVVGLRDYLRSPITQPALLPSKPEALPLSEPETLPIQEQISPEQLQVESYQDLTVDSLTLVGEPDLTVDSLTLVGEPDLTVDRLTLVGEPDLTVDGLNVESYQEKLKPANLETGNLEPKNLQLLNLQPVTPFNMPLSTQKLTGKTILITRAAGQSSQFSDMLQQEGAEVIEMPALVITPPSSWDELDNAIARLYDFDWLILTSSNAVEYFFERLQAQGKKVRSLDILKIAVVGKKTAASLKFYGRVPDFIPPNFVADSLVEKFPEPLKGRTVLFPRVESGGRDILVKELTAQGAEVTEVAAYESGCPTQIAPAALAALQQERVDVITFASSKTVKHFVQLFETFLPKDSQDFFTAQSRLQNVCIASIGPQTSNTCRQLLGRVDVEAPEYTLEGLTQAIVVWATDKSTAT